MALLQYVVLKTNEMDKIQAFYENIGFVVTKERHGKGPDHLALTLDDGVVIEFYPGSATLAGLGLYLRDAEARTRGIDGRAIENCIVKIVDPDGRILRFHSVEL